MSQMCKNLKRECCKTRWKKNKFYATSLLHPCMVQLISDQAQMCGNCQEIEELSCGPLTCVWEMHIKKKLSELLC